MRSTGKTSISAGYFDLIKRFPLRRIRSKSDYESALHHLVRISLASQARKDAGVIDYVEMLGRLIDDYELSQGMKLDTSSVTPADVVRHLMEESGLSVSALARQTGIRQSNLSQMLSGRRDFSKSAIAALCNRFKLSPSVFFPEVNRRDPVRGAA